MKTNDILLQRAQEAASNSYSPYSRFKVGAAILTVSGKIFVGCNVENSSFGLTMCAERNALGAAIVSGERSFSRIAIYIDHVTNIFPPCGACRQVLNEFSPEMHVDYFNKKTHKSASLKELLPQAFDLNQ